MRYQIATLAVALTLARQPSPEPTVETRTSYEAGARMGAGILECVTPAVLGASGEVITPASAECHTSELTLAEFKTLTGDGRLQPRRSDASSVPGWNT